MKVLFIHQNFPGQYKHLAPYFSLNKENSVFAIGDRANNRVDRELYGIKLLGYSAEPPGKSSLGGVEELAAMRVHRGKKVASLCLELRSAGFIPDVIFIHPGWGEGMFLRDLFPRSKIIAYAEYIRQPALYQFDQELKASYEHLFALKVHNLMDLSQFADADFAISPTMWQRKTFPDYLRDIIRVSFDGIDTNVVKPDPNVALRVANEDIVLDRTKQIVTYVNRGLEPIRGYHNFIRSIPYIFEKNPDCHILIVGIDKPSYWNPLNWNDKRNELNDIIKSSNTKNIHFLGKLPYESYVKVLQLSSAHVYLTMPFVISWSLFEAMSAGCAVIASGTEPVLEIIEDRVSGILVDYFNPEAIASAINEVLANDELSHKLGLAARSKMVSNYDLRSVSLPRLGSMIKEFMNN